MSERDAFIRAIAADLYDNTPRLAFADYLDERGEHDRAEFIRVQVELEPIRDKYEIPRAAELHEREDALLRASRERWLGAMPKGWDDWRNGVTVEFRRGFPDQLALPVRTFLALGAAARALHPTIRRVVLFRVNGYGERLAACGALEELPELELACWYTYGDARAISRSPHLTRLRVLVCWLGSAWPGHPDMRRCRVLGAATAWPHLRELTLLNPYADDEAYRRRLVATANKAAGREVAVYRVGFPELFPFAADFWYTFPGCLPDGRAAMAAADHSAHPPTLCVITFDARGEQTKDVIRVPVPEDVLKVPRSDWHGHKDKLQQRLIDVLGFSPGFIRVRDCRFPGDEHSYNSPSPDVIEELGQRDADDEASWNEWPTGYGGRTWHNITNGGGCSAGTATATRRATFIRRDGYAAQSSRASPGMLA